MIRRVYVYLFSIVLFAILLRLVFFSGVSTSDSVAYAKSANDLLNNKFPSATTQLNARIGVIIPTAISYSILGINDFSSVLFPLLTSVLGIIVIFYFGKFLFDENVGLIAAFLLSFFPLDVLYSTRLLSDLPSAFFAGLSIILFLKAEKITTKKINYLFYMLSGICLGIAFTIREMAILTTLFFLVYVLYNKDYKWVYTIVGIGFLLIVVIETGFFYFYTGNPFFKIEGADYATNTIVYGDSFYGRISFPKFFLTWPYVIFGNIQSAYFFIFIFLAVLYWLFHRKKEADYLLIWFFSILTYFYFGTTSIKQYVPVLAVVRYLNYITYPALILLAAFLMRKDKIIKNLLAPFIIIILLITSIGSIYLDEDRQSTDNLKAMYRVINKIDKPVYTDDRSKLFLEYLSGYIETDKIKQFNRWENSKNFYDIDLKGVRDVYILVNHRMMKNLIESRSSYEFPKEVYDPPKDWIIIKKISLDDEDTILYYAP